jgi:hypothetical protein
LQSQKNFVFGPTRWSWLRPCGTLLAASASDIERARYALKSAQPNTAAQGDRSIRSIS